MRQAGDSMPEGQKFGRRFTLSIAALPRPVRVPKLSPERSLSARREKRSAKFLKAANTLRLP